MELMNAAKSWVVEMDAIFIELIIWEFIQEAKSFYQEIGYRVTHHKKIKGLS
jgi:hypothetical protein